jgi:single-stranded DNA-specific DHH superfamily exonuclease
MIHIIHHNDPDGKLSAFFAWAWSQGQENKEVKFHSVNYDMPVPSDIKPDDLVIIVDFSFPPGVMKELLNSRRGMRLIWIDHHHTSLEAMEKASLTDIRGLRKNGFAGCELSYAYFIQGIENPDSIYPVGFPKWVSLVGTWDTWRHEAGDYTEEMKREVVEFMSGLMGKQQEPGDPYSIWMRLWLLTDITLRKPEPTIFTNPFITEAIEQIRYEGKIIESYMSRAAKTAMENAWKGVWNVDNEYYTVICRNGGSRGSMSFGEDINKYDLCVAYWHKEDHFVVSIYTTNANIDCGKLCSTVEWNGKRGGGHKGTAGFTCKELPFKPL